MAAVSACAFAGTAHVTFVSPEKFADIGPFINGPEAAANMAEIARHIEQLAARRLPADQVLEVDVLDVRLAGTLDPRRYRNTPYRVMREGSWPSITVRHRLTQGGSVLASGEETVSDGTYLHFINRYPDGDPLRFEKRMLDNWFDSRFVRRQVSSR
ncbi:MAG TPA: DUF3016 domain-containing protein [Burkholderiaceae bacterium]|nr:DUF3016 domain-containing protein [Burkholderiaceae bacterium]